MVRAFVIAALVAAAAPLYAAEPFDALEEQYWKQQSEWFPINATALGWHTHDDQLTDYSADTVKRRIATLEEWLTRLGRTHGDDASLPPARRLDRDAVELDARATLFRLRDWPLWQVSPRLYGDEAVGGVYGIVKRDFAPAAERLALVVARENAVPRLLTQAKQNLRDVPRISLELALQELPDDIGFLKNDAVAAFSSVKDPALQKKLAQSTEVAAKALADYAAHLKTLLPAARPDFALGAERFRKKLAVDEDIDEPLDAILARGEAELKRLQQAFKATAAKIDPKRTPLEVQASLAADHPPADKIIPDISGLLAGLRQFLVTRGIVTIPSPVMPIVQESPPFMRAFTIASMDTPGPFEKRAKEAYYNVTLPDPKWTPAETENYLRGAFSATVNRLVSIHEAFPGHYVQFLWMPQMKSLTRKIYGCSSNAEGWAHYAEQMMLDEGFGDGDPKLRLAQLQEALLRAARYVVGIRMHTRGMTVAQAVDFFVAEGLQSRKVAEVEAKRGTQDPTYLYYTYGKLEILKLRDDYKKKLGAAYSLRRFHDAFLGEGALPLPLVRRALLE
jgi:uncharacterized protein (DUF885 family)